MDFKTKPRSTPSTPHFKPSPFFSSHTNEEHEYIGYVSCERLVDSLMYVMVCSLLDNS